MRESQTMCKSTEWCRIMQLHAFALRNCNENGPDRSAPLHKIFRPETVYSL